MRPLSRPLCLLIGCMLGLVSVSSKAEDIRTAPGLLALARIETPRQQPTQDTSLAFSTELSNNNQTSIQNAEPDTIQAIDLTNRSEDLWSRIRRGFGMPDLACPSVDERVNYYASHPQALKTMLERGRKYLFHIVGELEKRGMPTELALLPLVESAFNPHAMSSAKAAGLWQLIPSTGKDFRLTQNWWVDERRDVVASTNAALQYLQALYEMHGDWQLALASYNWGENAVARAINNNKAAGKPTDFNSLNMPAETRQYVPKLQALKQLIAHPEAYGIALPNIPNQAYFKSVERKGGMDVAVAAKLAEMPQSEFLALNPAFNRPVIPGHHENDLVLPVENANKFEYNLAHYNQPLLNWKTYALPRSIHVDKLAKLLNISTDTLCKTNDIPHRALLAKGYTLLIPQSSDTSGVEEEPVPEISRSTQTRSRHYSQTANTHLQKVAQSRKTSTSSQKKHRSAKLANNFRNDRG